MRTSFRATERALLPQLRIYSREQQLTASLRAQKFTLLLFVLTGTTAWAQTTLSLASGSGVAGGTATLALSFNDTGNNQVAGLQWTLSYPSAVVTGATFTPAAALTGAAKTITCAASSGKYTCVATGANENVIPNGTVATVQLSLAANATSTTLNLNSALAASAPANSVSVTAIGGTVTVLASLPTLTSFTCSPTSLTALAAGTCTVTLSQPAPSGGVVVNLSTSNPMLGTPSSLTVPAGATTSVLHFTAGNVTSSQRAILTASVNGSLATVSFTLTTPLNGGGTSPDGTLPTLTSFTCNPTGLNSGGSTTCTVGISQAAPTGGTAVSLSSSNPLLATPASVTVIPGAISAQVMLTAGTISTAQTAVLTAILNGTARTATFTLSPPATSPAPPTGDSSSLSGFTCSPTTLGPGDSTTCSIMLAQAAPAGGVVVAVNSNNNFLASPASVTVAAGATVGTLVLTAGGAPVAQTVVLTATLNGSSKTVNVSLNPSPSLSSFTCNPLTLSSGSNANCSVVLSQAAPNGGAVISLSGNNPLLLSPASLTIPAGANTATVTLTAGAISAMQTAALTATLNGIALTTSFTLTPPMLLVSFSCNPTTLSSGAVSTCSASLSQPAPASGTAVSLSSTTALLPVPATLTVAAGSTTGTIQITAGTIASSQTGVLRATLNGSSATVSFALTAPATLSSLTCAPTTLSSGATSTCSVALSGPAPTGGAVVSFSTNPALLEVAASLTVAAGATTGTVTVTAGAISASQRTTLTATLNGTSQTAIFRLNPPSSATSEQMLTAKHSIPGSVPAIREGGVVNTASVGTAGMNGNLGQGSLFSVFGSGLGPDAYAKVDLAPFPSDLSGVGVKIVQGSQQYDAGLLMVSKGQINAILPPGVTLGDAQVVVTFNGSSSAPAPITVSLVSLGVFQHDVEGQTAAIAENRRSTGEVHLNLPDFPATPGSMVDLSVTGIGLAADETPVGITVGSVPAQRAFPARQPDGTAVEHIFFIVPSDTAFGCRVPVTITAGDGTSTTSIAVTADGLPCR